MPTVNKAPPSNITRIYRDLDVGFTTNPVTGDLNMVTGTNSVVQALMNLVQLNNYEKPFHPEISSSIRSLLFEPMDPIVANSLKVELVNLIGNFEPRVTIISLDVTPDYENDLFNVVIEFYVLNNTQPITINAFLQRVR
jgi:phage baseplate assembly protein W